MTLESHEKETAAEVEAAAERGTVDSCSRRAYRLIEDHLSSVGGMDGAAGMCGMNRGDLRRSLDRDGRRLALEHAMQIGARMMRHNTGIAIQIAAAIVRPFDLLVFPRVTLTDAERARRLEQLVRSMPMGAELVAKALETP